MFGADGGGGLAWLQTTTRGLDVDNMQEIVYYCAANDCMLTQINSPQFLAISGLLTPDWIVGVSLSKCQSAVMSQEKYQLSYHAF